MNYEVRWLDQFEGIPARDWDRLSQPLATPFLDWEWLASLERSGCVATRTGWQPNHLTLWRGNRLVAAAPLYLKAHSRGEFVFDQEWAEVSRQLEIPYYPKLLGMSPFTPVPGYRFLLDEDLDEVPICRRMMAEIDHFCERQGVPGCHFLHADPSWKDRMADLGMSPWLHHGLVWENRGYRAFEDYVQGFKSRQRNKIRRERKAMRRAGLAFHILRGQEAPPEFFSLMYGLYARTCEKFFNWSRYLNRPFFEGLATHFADRLLFVVASLREESQPVAMAMLAVKGDRLFGRYWGCRRHFEHLHFETCYYRPIEWAIQHGIRYFDAGSGNAHHKKRRGFPANPNYSLHKLYHPVMDEIWRANIDRINRLEQVQIDMLNQRVPNNLFQRMGD